MSKHHKPQSTFWRRVRRWVTWDNFTLAVGVLGILAVMTGLAWCVYKLVVIATGVFG